MSLFTELRRRNVFRVAIAYLIVGWLVMQVGEVMAPALNLPDWINSALAFFVILGFPVAMVMAWAFEVTPEGIRREQNVNRADSITHVTGRKLDFAIIGLLAIALAYFVYESRIAGRDGTGATHTDAAATLTEPGDTDAPADEPRFDPRSIAVLPFANRSASEEDRYFTDGIHDDLLTELAKIRDLKVISRTSMMQYRETEKSIPEIANELGVAAILEGGVQRAGDRVRINAQLIDVSNDQHLWAETFDREMTMENLFDIQSEIASRIVLAVRGELSDSETKDLAQAPTESVPAYEAYLKARSLTMQPDYRIDNYIEAEHWAREAVKLDPEFAEAWALLVGIGGNALWMGYDLSPERIAMTQESLANAVKFGPDLAETIAAQAEYQYRVEQDFTASARLYEQAHEALPGDATILFHLATAQRRTPDYERALENLQRVNELDPNNSRAPTTLVESLVFLGRYDEASRQADHWAAIQPDAEDLRALQVVIAIRQGNIVLARALLDRVTPFVGVAYFFAAQDLAFLERDYDGVIEQWRHPMMQRFAATRGSIGTDYLARAWALRLDGQVEAAQSEARKGIEVMRALEFTGLNHDAFELSTLGEFLALTGDPEGARAAVDRSVELLDEDRDLFFGSLLTQANVRVLALAGERDRALADIERLLDAPYPINRWLLHLDPRWDFMRDDPRFVDLARPEGVES